MGGDYNLSLLVQREGCKHLGDKFDPAWMDTVLGLLEGEQ